MTLEHALCGYGIPYAKMVPHPFCTEVSDV